MSIRLFNDNGCETPTDLGHQWEELIESYLLGLYQKAEQEGISLRDVESIIISMSSTISAEQRLRRGLQLGGSYTYGTDNPDK